MSMRRNLVAALVVAGCALTSCGSDEVSKQEYLDHAVKFSTAAKTDEQKAAIRSLFDCVWPAISKDRKLLDDFMASDFSNDSLSTRLSPLMVPCVTKAS
ncbi:MAG: hypothetical protein U0Q22_18490 [Acidimicrobiales bacterium]